MRKIYKKLKGDVKKIPISVSIMIKIGNQAWGEVLETPVKPQCVFSIDDTIVYTYEGNSNMQDIFHVVLTKSLDVAGNQSKYSIKDSSMMSDMRVIFTFTFSSVGTSAPFF